MMNFRNLKLGARLPTRDHQPLNLSTSKPKLSLVSQLIGIRFPLRVTVFAPAAESMLLFAVLFGGWSGFVS